MPSPVIIASGNRGKIRELSQLLLGSELQPVTPLNLGIVLEVEETGSNYLENALAKGQAYARAAGMAALADDSGIEVDALGGAPGIYSARFGGEVLTDEERTDLLLEKIRSVDEQQRSARYLCALVLVSPNGAVLQSEGICEGVIAQAPRGSNGFGYDPVFFIPELGKTMAELSSDEKNRLSHRALAVQSLLGKLADSGAAVEQAMNDAGEPQVESIALSHLDARGRARMVDVTEKADTNREAIARGRVQMQPATLGLIVAGEIVKGNVLTTAQLGGIMAAKRTHELIPLCHPLPLTGIQVDLEPNPERSCIEITARVRTTAKTGVEMEALTAVSVAALTVYDMCKAVDRGIRIGDIRLVEKRGGKSGEIILE